MSEEGEAAGERVIVGRVIGGQLSGRRRVGLARAEEESNKCSSPILTHKATRATSNVNNRKGWGLLN